MKHTTSRPSRLFGKSPAFRAHTVLPSRKRRSPSGIRFCVRARRPGSTPGSSPTMRRRSRSASTRWAGRRFSVDGRRCTTASPAEVFLSSAGGGRTVQGLSGRNEVELPTVACAEIKLLPLHLALPALPVFSEGFASRLVLSVSRCSHAVLRGSVANGRCALSPVSTESPRDGNRSSSRSVSNPSPTPHL